MSSPRPDESDRAAAAARRRRRKRRDHLIVAFGVLGVVTAVLTVASRREVAVAPARDAAADAPAPPVDRLEDQISVIRSAAPPRRVADDGRSLWAPPTDGERLELAYLPPGVQLILHLRPASLLAHAEGEKVRAATGPLGRAAVDFVERSTGLPLEQIDELTVGWQVDRSGWQPTLVAQARAPLPPRHILATHATATAHQHAGGSYWTADELAYYLPAAAAGRTLVVAPPEAIEQIIDLGGSPPPLVRDLQRLLDSTDRTRHVSLLFAPAVLSAGSRSLSRDQLATLRDAADWLLGDGLAAVALSAHWDDDFFLELRALPTLDTRPNQLAAALAGRVAELPDRIERHVVQLDPAPYGRRVVARFPAMVRKLASYTRSGYDSESAILRSYLPAVAGHNLLLGGELTLAESTGSARLQPQQNPTAAAPQSLRDRLARRTSLRFPRDTLEAALAMLGEDVGARIVILGRDLQLDGITKNQSFGIDVRDRPAEEILVEILRLANPDKTATGPGDPRQKLVYVIRPTTPGGPEAVYVTTRSRAAQRGEELPAAFRVKP